MPRVAALVHNGLWFAPDDECDAQGFIKLYALRRRIRSELDRR